MAVGFKTGGRKSGTPNKFTSYKALKEQYDSPFKVLFDLAFGKAECGECRGSGKILGRPCKSCYGDGLERVSPHDRLKAAAELCQYEEAKKASRRTDRGKRCPVAH